MAAYDQIGDGYNQTRTADPYIVSRLLHFLSPREGQIFLDIGCGTGNYTNELYRSGLSMIGVDPSENMLHEARRTQPEIDWRNGVAEKIPAPNQSVDGVIATLTTHHWQNLPDGFAEIWRILIPGGRCVLFTSTPHLMRQYWLMHYFPEMMEHSNAVMPSLEQTVTALTKSGLSITAVEPYGIQPDLADKFLYSGKQNPNRYLDAEFRHGISSFRLFAGSEELRSGLNRLAADIESGRWNNISEKYQNEDGDYLFLVAEKPPRLF